MNRLTLVLLAGSFLAFAAPAFAQSGQTLYRNNCATAGCHNQNPLADRHPTLGHNRLALCARNDVPNAVSCLQAASFRDAGMQAAFSLLDSTQLSAIAAYLNSVFIPAGGAPSCTLAPSSGSPRTGTTITLTATCTNSPTSYAWTNCSSTTSTCQATSSVAGDRGYSVTATNASGTSAPASTTVTWIANSGPPPGPTTSVVEYFHAGFGHYFITGFAAEVAVLDSGSVAGWTRTGRTFNAFGSAATGLVAVCRFFTTAFAPRSSHFYSAIDAECTGLKQPGSVWIFEADGFFMTPTDAAGACPAGTTPVYRLYNNGVSGAPNHRYTTDLGVRAQMIGQGWTPEGFGADGVGFCAPL